MTDRFTYDAGPYVLGALHPEERRAFEEHLATCRQCRAEVQEFAGLPGLLSRLPAGELPAVLQGSPEPAPPVSVLPALLREAGVERTSRRRRTILVGIAAALAVAGGSVGVTDAVVGGAAPVVAQAQPQVLHFIPKQVGLPVSADATVTDVPGGTRIVMSCRYTGPLDDTDEPTEYKLRYVPKGGGAPRWLNSWPVLSDDAYRLDMVVPVARDKIDKFEVVWNGTAVLTLPMS
jgi:Putative zinc-finger